MYASATGGTVAYTRFVYHGAHVAFETDSAGTLTLRYTWGLGTDDLLAVRDAAGNHYYAVQDVLGSVRGLVKRDGTWARSLRYGPYGAVVADTAGAAAPSWELRYRWTGREYDAETGWYYFRARYYDAAVRRFVQEDPIGYGGGSNVYAYGEGGPLEGRDPSGLRSSPMEILCGACVLGGGGGGGFLWALIHGSGGPGVYLDGARVPSSCVALWDASLGTSVFLDPHHPAILTTLERRAMLTAYYNALGALDAAAEALQRGSGYAGAGDEGGASSGYYTPKSGDELWLSGHGEDFLDENGHFMTTATFVTNDIVNLGTDLPWGRTSFHLNLDLDPSFILANPNAAFYSGKVSVRYNAWYEVSIIVFPAGGVLGFVGTRVQ